VLELCELNLKDWLTQVKGHALLDAAEDRVQFSTHISHGMQHLHSRDILHRRLGARNVLLQRTTAGLIAKVSGFGPMPGEEASSKGAGDERIPIKWMAPETLLHEQGRPRVYTKQSDVWSFGVTLWEIFSEGQLHGSVDAMTLSA
jgi:serine/threonine protein kinase